MEIRMLGPFELVHDNQQVKLAGPRAQTALAVLALEANRIVSVDRLVSALWNDAPPSTARGQIQICVSALRRAFTKLDQPGLITTRSPGYLLEVGDEMIDAQMFDRHLENAAQSTTAGRVDEAGTEIRAALGLWRGPVLTGLDSEILFAAGQRFDERRLTAIEDLCDIDLAGGRPANIPKLRDLVGEHPLREHLHAQLMIALHRSGRQAEALEAYRNVRAVLVDELGIEPGEELRRLEHNILTGRGDVDLTPIVVRDVEPVREPPAAVPRLLPADIADFTGREESLDEIALALADDDDDRSAVPVLVLSGTGGVGKSALAVRAAQRVAENFPDGQLYANLQGATADPIPSGQLLFSFLRVLGVSPNAIADDLDGRADLFRSHLSNRRVLIVLDDAGAESQVVPLLPGSARCAVLITSRTRLVGLPGAHHVDVTTLPSDRAVELLSRIAGQARIQAEPVVSAELARLCGHLPLALRIVGAKLVGRPHWRVSDLVARLDETRRLDELVHGDLDVRASIALSYEGLDTAARQLLRRLAILDAPHVASWAAAALLDIAVEPAQDLLEVLGEAELLDPFRDQTTGEVRYRFHELIRLFGRERLLEEESPAERTEALRRTLSAWLTLAEEAHRAEYGGDYTLLHSSEPRWATFSPVTAIIRARPIAWLVSERAGLVAAVRQAAAAGFDELCWDLAMTSVTLFETKAYYDDWRDVTDIALYATGLAGNRRGRAAMLASAGERHLIQQHYDEALAALLAALDLFVSVGDRHGQALVRRNLTFIDRLRGDTAAAYTQYAALVGDFDAVGDQIAKAHVLNGMARIKLDDGDASAAEKLLADALVIALHVGSRRVEAQVRHALGEAYLSQGAFEPAAKAFHWVLRIVRHNGDEIGETYALHGLGMVRHREGRYADAEASLTSALRIARRIGEPLVEARVLHRADHRRLSGAAGARAEHLRL